MTSIISPLLSSIFYLFPLFSMRFQLKMPMSPFQPLPLAKDGLWSLAPFGMAGVAVDVDAVEVDFGQHGFVHIPRANTYLRPAMASEKLKR